MRKLIFVLAIACLIGFGITAHAEKVPSFSLAWSEYPSWSIFGVADTFGLINGNAGELGPIEKKWNVDIVLEMKEYDPCIQGYATGNFDAVCITDMDVLKPSTIRASVVTLPTSTSYGGDGCLVDKSVTTVTDLKKIKVYGLEASVSEYTFDRYLELSGENPADYTFASMDPGLAALAMQQRQAGTNAIMVWNPFVLSTLDKRPDVRVIFDSRKIPAEIIDTVVMAQSCLDKPGGDRFACAVIDVYYQMQKRLADPATEQETTVEVGKKFSSLNYASMKKALTQTRCYTSPDQALSLFSDGTAFPGGAVETDGHLKAIMERVTSFCVNKQMVDRKPVIAYGDKTSNPKADLRFDPTYIQRVASGK